MEQVGQRVFSISARWIFLKEASICLTEVLVAFLWVILFVPGTLMARPKSGKKDME